MTTRYTPGDWHAVVTPAGVALLPPDLESEVIEAVWDRLASGKGLGGVLESLTGAFGTSLSAIPPFAVVVSGAIPVRLAVRGELDVRVTMANGESVVISGLGVTTWSERLFDDAAAVDIGGHGASPETRSFVLQDGIALASGIRLMLRAVETAADIAPSAPAVAEPADASEEPQAEEPAADDDEPPTDESPFPLAEETWAPQAETVSGEEPLPEQDADEREGTPADPGSMPDADEVAGVEPEAESAEATSSPQTVMRDHHGQVDDTYDQLWESTVVKSIEDAAVRPAAEPETDGTIGQRPVPEAGEGDHDGETISWAEAQRLRGSSATGSEAAVPPPSATTGSIELSTGQRVLLDRPVVIGRRPRAVRVTGVLPHLVAVDSPEQDISRSHIEIRREGDVTLVVDLDTTNGTILRREGSAPMRLHPGEATIVIGTDVLDLGDGITVTFQDIG